MYFSGTKYLWERKESFAWLSVFCNLTTLLRVIKIMHGGENNERKLRKPGSPPRVLYSMCCRPLKGGSFAVSFPILCSLSDYNCRKSYLFILDMLNIRYAKYIEPKKLREVPYAVRITMLQASRGEDGSHLSSTHDLLNAPNSGFITPRQDEHLKSEETLGDTSSLLVNEDFVVVLCLPDLENLSSSLSAFPLWDLCSPSQKVPFFRV